MSEQLTRQLQILLVLPRFPRFVTQNQLEEILARQGFDVYKRKIQRDVKILENAFQGKIGIETYKDYAARMMTENKISVALMPDKSQHIFWENHAEPLNLASLNVNQALSLSLLKKFLTPLFPRVTLDDLEPFFDEASNTLDHLNLNCLAKWPDKIAIVNPSQPLLTPEIDPKIQEIVSEALLLDRQLHIQYRRSDGNEGSYTLNPLGLVLRNGSSYLIASKADSTDKILMFVLHRFLHASQLDTAVIRPENFNLQRYIDEGHMGFDLTGGGKYQPIKLKAIFDRITANHLSESRLSEDQVIKKLDDEHYEISATVQETEQLFWWLLSFGFRVEVLEPLALRHKMAASVKVLAEKYQIDKID